MGRNMETTPRYFTPPADHFFLLGPRGTGKTWLTQRCFPEALRVDLLEPGEVVYRDAGYFGVQPRGWDASAASRVCLSGGV